jgi:hypothetical protein
MRRLFALLLGATCALHAQIVNYTFTGTIERSDLSAAFSVGDRYVVTFALDLGAQDGNWNPQYGGFLAVYNFAFSLSPGAVGSYTGATMNSPGFLSISQSEDYAYVNFNAWPPNYPDPSITGHMFDSLSLFLYSSNSRLVNFSNAYGDSLGSVLPVLNFSDFDNSKGIEFAFDNYSTRVTGSIDFIAAVPEPASTAPILASLLFVFAGIHKFRRRLT